MSDMNMVASLKLGIPLPFCLKFSYALVGHFLYRCIDLICRLLQLFLYRLVCAFLWFYRYLRYGYIGFVTTFLHMIVTPYDDLYNGG